VARVMWNGSVIAESDKYEMVEGNVYFPPESLNREYLRESNTHSICPWKGQAYYYDLVLGIILIQNRPPKRLRIT